MKKVYTSTSNVISRNDRFLLNNDKNKSHETEKLN